MMIKSLMLIKVLKENALFLTLYHLASTWYPSRPVYTKNHQTRQLLVTNGTCIIYVSYPMYNYCVQTYLYVLNCVFLSTLI